MRSLSYKTAGFALLMTLFLAPGASTSQHRHEKPVSIFDGGVLFVTDGNAPGGACFRLHGRLTAPQFFDDFKRIDGDTGAQYVSGTQVVTEFPTQVHVSFVIRDFSCSSNFQETGKRNYLTEALVSSMRLQLYWKRGIELRPIEKVSEEHYYVQRVLPYARENIAELPERFEWFYQMTVPSAGIPLTDDLVVILRNPDGRFAARVAARL